MNNFIDYGFKGNFKGEILKICQMPESKYTQYVGILYENHTPYTIQWDGDGICIHLEGYKCSDDELKKYNLTKISKGDHMLINKENEFLYFTIKNEVRKRVAERMEYRKRVPDNSSITLIHTPAIATIVSEVLKLLNKSNIRLHTIMLHLKKLNNNFSINTISEYILLVINSNDLISKYSLSKIGTTKYSIEVDKVKDMLSTVTLNSTKGDNIKIITGLVDSIFNVDISNILQYHRDNPDVPICTTSLAIVITQYCGYTPIHKDYITDELVTFIKYLNVKHLDDEYDLNHDDSSIGIGLDTNVIELLSTSSEGMDEVSLELVNKYELDIDSLVNNDNPLTIQELVNIIYAHLLDTHEYLPFNTLNHSHN